MAIKEGDILVNRLLLEILDAYVQWRELKARQFISAMALQREMLENATKTS